MNNTFHYVADKVTKNTIRFQPDTDAQAQLGQATIYIQKSALPQLGIKDPMTTGITLTIKEG